ncbi:glycoside hydrolase family 25 protein [Pinibacter soli]|uniref:Glycoside hydrolase family 25 protein n=1 Tax=Pinibacter soli TaxID=3044211 RepID=A0ABT6RJG4_9BACT|nr:glycoside hydrolase family 25 protein [Pinibacter soli]MDI3322703.1 glycoside hydrolase family 25 protein [Pinibacter soli]
MLLQVSAKKLNKRSGFPPSLADKNNIVGVALQGFKFEGEETEDPTNPAIGKWYRDKAGIYYWGGGVIRLPGRVISNFKNLPINLPAGFSFGVDVSHHNDAPDWNAFKNAGCEFVYIKTSEGVGTPDMLSATHVHNAKLQNFKIGYYHFCRPDTRNGGSVKSDATAEANEMISRIATLASPDLPIVLDLEDQPTWDSPLGKADYLLWVNTFIEAIDAHFTKGVMLYSRKEYLDRKLPANHGLGKHKLWMSYYPSNPDATKVPVPNGWNDWAVWQYTEHGTIGRNPTVDLNILKDTSLLL